MIMYLVNIQVLYFPHANSYHSSYNLFFNFWKISYSNWWGFFLTQYLWYFLGPVIWQSLILQQIILPLLHNFKPIASQFYPYEVLYLLFVRQHSLLHHITFFSLLLIKFNLIFISLSPVYKYIICIYSNCRVILHKRTHLYILIGKDV